MTGNLWYSVGMETNTLARNSNGMPLEPYMGFARNFLGCGYNCPALNLHGYRSDSALNAAIRNSQKITNRFGHTITQGIRVRMTQARGGTVEGVVKALDRNSTFAKAYGARVTLDCGMSGAADAYAGAVANGNKGAWALLRLRREKRVRCMRYEQHPKDMDA